jgi:hypothetical protein
MKAKSQAHPTEREPLPPENVSRSVEPPLKPTAKATRKPRITDITWFQFVDHQGFEKRLDLTGYVNSKSCVFVSISEIAVIGGEWKPHMGLASMEVHNVVPHDDGIVIVRGHIGWDRDLNVRLSVFVAQ